MQIIKPKQISGEIMTLIDEADERLVLVSPYCEFETWTKLRNSLESCVKRGIDIQFYVRHDQQKSIAQVEKVGFKPISIRNLHTKMYFNEEYAIVTSMNLVEFSDKNSLDIAYKTENKKEFDELQDYYKRYIEQSLESEQTFMNDYELDCRLYEARKGFNEYNTIWHHSKIKLSSPSITKITTVDSIQIISDIVHFIDSVKDFKGSVS